MGLSSPNCCLTSATISGFGCFPANRLAMASEPPPGSRKKMEYVITTITTRTNTTHKSRRMMYLPTFLPSNGGSGGAAVPAAPPILPQLSLRDVHRREAVVHRGVHVGDDPRVLVER